MWDPWSAMEKERDAYLMLEERLLIRSLALLVILWEGRLAVEVCLPIIAVSGSTQHVEDASLLIQYYHVYSRCVTHES